MPGITGRGTTFNLPNYHGPLLALSPEDTPFLSSIGGLSGGGETFSTEFEWQGYDVRSASATRQRLEGADAPTAEARTRQNFSNVVEIHQEALDLSYTRLATTQQYAGANVSGGVNTPNPVVDENARQIDLHLRAKALDVNLGFIVGRYQKPSDNLTPRRTRGIMEATSASNIRYASADPVTDATGTASTDNIGKTAHGLENGDVVVLTSLTGGEGLLTQQAYYVVEKADNTFKVSLTKGGAAVDITTNYSALTYRKLILPTKTDFDELLQTVWQNGGIRRGETATLLVGAGAKRLITKIYITDAGYEEGTRNVGGVDCMTIITDFGTLNVMLDRAMPDFAYQVVSLEECEPIFLNIPDVENGGSKGYFFVEPLARSGASVKNQIYGELGLRYGSPSSHGRLWGLGLQMD